MKNDVQSEILSAFTAHGIDAHLEGQVLHVPLGSLRIESDVEEKRSDTTGAFIVLHVVVHSNQLGNEPLVESFAGLGQTHQEAILHAFEKFLKGTFHVLLEALCRHSCDENQGEWEEWQSPAASWSVCSSLLLNSSDDSGQVLAKQCGDFIRSLKSLVEDLEKNRVHWFRVFVCVFQGEVVGMEVLLDNASWDKGEALAKEWGWILPQAYTSVRAFAVCLPQIESQE